MGSSHSIAEYCVPHLKKGQETRNKPCLVLTGSDFRGKDLSHVAREDKKSTHVVLCACDGWIPTDEDVKKLAELSSITSVDFSGCDGITRRGIMSISFKLDKIKTLILNDCPRISDTFLECDIVRFRYLERLEVRGCFNISDSGVKFLLGLKHLRYLDLSMNAKKKKLTTCNDKFDTDKISDQSLRFIGRVEWLQTLILSHRSKLTDAGIVSLIALRNLVHLNLSWTGLTDPGLKILKSFPDLKILDVSGCSLTEKCVASGELNRVTSLTKLNLSSISGLNDVFLKELTVLSKLRCLNISRCDKLTDVGLQHLTMFPSLAILEANNCVGITGKGVCYLSNLTSLQQLHMSEAMDINYDHILQLTNLQQLEMGIRAIDAEELTKLTALESLKELILCLPNSTNNFKEMCVAFSGRYVQISVKRAQID
eukprot:g240.t1